MFVHAILLINLKKLLLSLLVCRAQDKLTVQLDKWSQLKYKKFPNKISNYSLNLLLN